MFISRDLRFFDVLLKTNQPTFIISSSMSETDLLCKYII